MTKAQGERLSYLSIENSKLLEVVEKLQQETAGYRAEVFTLREVAQKLRNDWEIKDKELKVTQAQVGPLKAQMKTISTLAATLTAATSTIV